MSTTSSRAWLPRRLAAASVLVLVSALCGCGAETPEEPAETPEPSAASRGFEEGTPTPRVVGMKGLEPRGKRRVENGCEPVAKALEWQSFVGGKALAILRWEEVSEQTAALKIPVYVVGVEDGAIGVRFLQFPAREEYLLVWLGSGHIRAVPESETFLMDPCSAKLEPWPYPEEG